MQSPVFWKKIFKWKILGKIKKRYRAVIHKILKKDIWINACMFITTGDYMGTNGVYEDILDINSLKKLMGEKLEDYNETPGMVTMDLVLFRDAIEHSKLNAIHRY